MAFVFKLIWWDHLICRLTSIARFLNIYFYLWLNSYILIIYQAGCVYISNLNLQQKIWTLALSLFHYWCFNCCNRWLCIWWCLITLISACILQTVIMSLMGFSLVMLWSQRKWIVSWWMSFTSTTINKFMGICQSWWNKFAVVEWQGNAKAWYIKKIDVLRCVMWLLIFIQSL